MRVIAGHARHIQLKTVPGMETRPTTDRIKETLFNMLQFDVIDASMLDLFSGSGAIGIEALSRGASRVVFVENQIAALSCIRENLKNTHLEVGAEVYGCDVMQALNSLAHKQVFHIVFMDPPYRAGFEQPVLEKLVDACLVDEDSLIIVEALKDTSFDFASKCGLQVEKEKIYKTNKHVFLRLVRRT